jgi:hypothetical protein
MMTAKRKFLYVNTAASGGVPLRNLFLVVTLIAVGAAIALLLRYQQEQHAIHYSKALVISEYGLQLALETLQQRPSWREGIPETVYNKGSYRVSMSAWTAQDTTHLRVESVGRSGQMSRIKVMHLILAVRGGDSLWIPLDIGE